GVIQLALRTSIRPGPQRPRRRPSRSQTLHPRRRLRLARHIAPAHVQARLYHILARLPQASPAPRWHLRSRPRPARTL
ncbi:hypothetical protein LTR40_013256, partial [Exophiala xenobiotica]